MIFSFSEWYLQRHEWFLAFVTDGNQWIIEFTCSLQQILLLLLLYLLCFLPSSTLSHIVFTMSSPDTSSPSIDIKCLRCSEFDLQCTIPNNDTIASIGRSKFLCNHCDAPGLNCCLFPPSIRLVNHRSNSACISCRQHHRTCVFANAEDDQCTYCSKRHISCLFKLNGKLLFLVPNLLFFICELTIIAVYKVMVLATTLFARGSHLYRLLLFTPQILPPPNGSAFSLAATKARLPLAARKLHPSRTCFHDLYHRRTHQ